MCILYIRSGCLECFQTFFESRIKRCLKETWNIRKCQEFHGHPIDGASLFSSLEILRGFKARGRKQLQVCEPALRNGRFPVVIKRLVNITINIPFLFDAMRRVRVALYALRLSAHWAMPLLLFQVPLHLPKVWSDMFVKMSSLLFCIVIYSYLCGRFHFDVLYSLISF